MEMKFTAFNDQTGQVMFSGDASEPGLLGLLGVSIVTGEEYQGGWLDLETMEHNLPGDPPSIHHVFDYTTKQWIDPRTEQTQWPVVRSRRNAMLSASDWTQLPDVPLATKEAWATYRQALRDVTLQADPFAIVWPVSPGV